MKIGNFAPTASMIVPADGLKGQVIINDKLSGGSWAGTITVGSTVLSPASSGNAQSPFYRIPSSTLGGGAIGLAPFRVYDIDCEPQALADPNNPPATSGVLESAFNGLSDVPVKVRFYGPIKRRTVSSWQQAIKVECRDLNSTCGWMTADMTSAFIVRGPGDSGFQYGDRTITLQRNPSFHPKPGIYRVIPVGFDNDDADFVSEVICKDVVNSSDPGNFDSPALNTLWPVNCSLTRPGEGAFVFRILADCNNNGISDLNEIASGLTLDANNNGVPDSCDINPCAVDHNADRTINTQDIFDFLNSWFAGCTGQTGSPCFGRSADFNQASGLNVQDIFDFLNAWFTADGSTCNPQG
ncbi:MAG: hypothetical protein K2W85_04565 [Phycisphaerales bacterium]|nr:hypothetical protein [Phycisphaerales bacterium]